MVGNKHSINTILSFGAKSVNPEILEQLLTGRADTADFFENKVKAIVNDNNNQFWLIIGQRGMGKTHLLSVLHSRIWHYVKGNKLVVAYFAEEEYGVDNFFDFLLRVLNSFIKWYDEDKELLSKELEKLQQLPTKPQQLNYIQKIIKNYIAEKPLLILTENFGDILELMGKEEQGRLRTWLYENNKVSIIATSQSISDDFDREDRPFYGFFTPYYLKNLSFEESLSFLMSLAEMDKDEKLVTHLKGKGKAQVRAIYDLVKGNHRLLVTFYHFLKTDTLAKVSNSFIKTINDLKPYYETYIRYLPAQQQKILRYIALSRKPQKGVEISKNCFIEQKSLSKQLSELVRKHLLDANADPNDKRNKFYDISEPLLRISIEVGEHKEGITTLFIDFLAHYYNINELFYRADRFKQLLSICSESEKKDVIYELKAVVEALKIKKENIPYYIEIILDLITKGEIDTAKQLFFNNVSENDNELNLIISIKSFEINKHKDAISYFRKTDINKLDFIIKGIFSEENYYKMYVNSLLNLYLENNNQKLLLEATTTAEKFYFDKGIILDEYISSLALKALDLMDTENIDDAKKITNKIINLDFYKYSDEVKYFVMELIGNIWEGKEKIFTNKFINYISSFDKNKRIDLYKKLSEGSHYFVFATIVKIIEEDIKNSDISETITNWITNILIGIQDATSKDLDFINNFISKNKQYIPELAISEIYVNTYREVILNKNESALYELPKEQREFFEKNILKNKNRD